MLRPDPAKPRMTSVALRGVITLSLLLCFAFLYPEAGLQASTGGVTFYVSPNGDDSNPGTSEDLPFRAVQHAVDQMAQGDTLIVLDGLYMGTLELKSGITIKARNPRRAVFSGLTSLNAPFEPHREGIYKAAIGFEPKQVFYDGQPMTWAQWPNLQWSENWIADRKWVAAADGTGPGVLTSTAFEEVADLDLEGGYCFIRYGKGNSCYSRQIESFDGSVLRWNDNKFYSSRFTGEDGRKGYGERLRNMKESHPNHPTSSLFFLAGDLDLLDAPGEWFVEGGALYLYPPHGAAPVEGAVLAKRTDYCINEKAAISDLVIEGIDFFACSVALVNPRNDDIVVRDAHFTYPGAELLFTDRVQGIAIDKPIEFEGSNIRIEKSLFAGAQNTALKLRGSGIAVSNSVFVENNRHGNFESRALALEATGVYTITRNTFFNNHSDAILVRAKEYVGEPGEAEISWNNIFNGGKYNTDVSGIYLPTDSQHYAEVHHNWIHNINGQAFRLDLGGRKLSLHHNVFWSSTRGMSVEGYGEFNIYNNTDVHNEIPSDLIRNVLNHTGVTDASLDKSFPPIEDWNVLNNLVEKFQDRVGPREKITHNEQKRKGRLHPERDASWLIPITDRGSIRGNLTGEHREVFTQGDLPELNLVPTDPVVKNGAPQTRELADQYVKSLGSYRGAYDVNDEYWYPGSDWMPYGLGVLKTMAEAEKFAKDHLSVSIVPRIEGLPAGRFSAGQPAKKASTALKLDFEYVGLAVQKENTHVWGTSAVMGRDGKVHLYVAEWPMPEGKKKGFSGYFTTSEIAHYVGDSPEGPFEFVRMVVTDKNGSFNAPHNPTIKFIDDQYVLCFIVNENDDRGKQRIIMYVSDDLNDEWRPAEGAEPDGTILRRPDDVSVWNHTSVRGVANPTLIKHNGQYLLYFKSAIPDPEKDLDDFYNREFGYGLAVSNTLEGPYEIKPERLTSKEMELEDAYAFSHGDSMYMLSRDIAATLGDKEGGLLWKSDDGLKFSATDTQRAFESLVSYVGEEALQGAKTYRGSLKGQLERPQLLIQNGQPTYLYVATGVNPNKGFGSSSHVFKVKIAQ